MEFATSQHIHWTHYLDALHEKLTKNDVGVDRIDRLKELARIPLIHEWP